RAGAVGSLPGYCYEADAPGQPVHNPVNAYRERQRLAAKAAGRPVEDQDRPVSTARLRAGSIRDEALSALETGLERYTQVVEELRTLSDPEAAAVETAADLAEAEQHVAEARNQAAQAEAARAAAQAERDRHLVAAEEMARQTELAEAAAEAARTERDEA